MSEQVKKIEIQEIQSGYAIEIPYDLKDQFRSNFPSSKWDANKKLWKVGTRSKTRLITWVKNINDSNILEELENRDNIEMTEKELKKLQEKLAEIKYKISAYIKKSNSCEENLLKIKKVEQLISNNMNKLEDEKIKNRQLEQQEDDKIIELEKKFTDILDLDVIHACVCSMNRLSGKVGSRLREEFESYQQKINIYRKRLNGLGFDSYALREMVSANFNRPDRDKFNFSTSEIFSTIYAIKIENHEGK